MRIPQAGDFVTAVTHGAFACDTMDSPVVVPDGADVVEHDVRGAVSGDIHIKGWLTTTKKNSYDQIVAHDTFDHETGMSQWNGRMLMEHGRQFLIGGGNGTPVGQFTQHQFVKGKGLWGKAHIYKENSALLKRAVRDGTLNALSIGFTIAEDGAKYSKKEDTLFINKGHLLECSLCDVGANDEALFEVINSVRNYKSQAHDYSGFKYVIWKGVTYLINREGEVFDA